MKVRSQLYLLLALLSPLRAQAPDPQGYWEGSIILSPAESELDLIAEVSRDRQGTLQGRLWFPTHPVGPFDIEGLSLHGGNLSFHVRDKDGVVSSFQGELSADSRAMKGTFQESSRTYPFALTRRAMPPPVEVAIQELADDGAELKQRFDRDTGSVRLLLVLSPISLSAKMTLKLVQRYVLEEMASPAVRVYVVWEVPQIPGAEKLTAQRFKPLTSDPRVLEFWSKSGAATRAMHSVGAAQGDEMLNRCFLFASGTQWGQSLPTPDRIWMSTRLSSQPEVPKPQRFDAGDLAAAVRVLLGGKNVRRG